MQLVFNILITFSVILLIALSFQSVYQTTKFFCISHSTIIIFGAYFVNFFYSEFGINLLVSIILGIFISSFVNLLIYKYIYIKLLFFNASPMVMLILSIGVNIVLQNIVIIIWGNEPLNINNGNVEPGIKILNGYITKTHLLLIIVSLISYLATLIIRKKSKIGLKMLSLSSNTNLSKIFGINIEKTILFSVIISSIIASLAGVLVAFDTGITPLKGFNLLLYGVVALIIGGVNNSSTIIIGALLVASSQHLGAYFISSKWIDLVVYAILLLFLILKPTGLSNWKIRSINV